MNQPEKISPVTEENLNLWFDYYNEECFEGKVPKVPVRIIENLCSARTKQGILGQCGRYQILISSTTQFSSRLSRGTLIHEMVHKYRSRFDWLRDGMRMKRPDGHGELFKKDILDLMVRGFYYDLI